MRTLARNPFALSIVAVAATLGLAAATASSVAPGVAIPSVPAGGRPALASLERSVRTVGPQPGRPVPGTVNALHANLTQKSYFNWAGFAVDGSAGTTYHAVSGAWKVNKIVCPKDEDRLVVFWVGLDGFNNSTVEQAGTGASCTDGAAAYFTWWEMYPANQIQIVGTTVEPRDRITARVSVTGGTYTLQVTDATTTGNSFTKTQTCSTCTNSSAEWIAESPGRLRGQTPWPNFGTWRLTRASATSGTTQGPISRFPDNEITLIGSSTRPLATTGVLGTTGTNFAVRWSYAWQ